MIKNLIFDFGKVLVDYNFEAFFCKYIPDTARCQAFIPVLYNDELQQLLDREERPFEVIMEEWIENNKDFEPEIRYFNEHYPESASLPMTGPRTSKAANALAWMASFSRMPSNMKENCVRVLKERLC